MSRNTKHHTIPFDRDFSVFKSAITAVLMLTLASLIPAIVRAIRKSTNESDIAQKMYAIELPRSEVRIIGLRP